MFLGFGKADKITVGLAVTPSLGLEACVYDKETMQVTRYGQASLEYNMATKEIQDPAAFRSQITNLFNELGIAIDSVYIYLVLPNVFFGFRSFDDNNAEKDFIEEIISKDASNSYIFKQEPPVSAWVDMNEGTSASGKYIAHASFQNKAINAIQDAMQDLGTTIIGVESSATAVPRAIGLTGLCQDAIQIDTNWNILQINPNGYVIFQMCGERLLDYIEVPFAIMSFEGDEIYSALSSAAAQYLQNYPAKKLVIYSMVDSVSARKLKNEIVFDNEVVTIDANVHSRDPLINISQEVIPQKAAGMSMNVLAAALPKYDAFKTLNIFGNISLDGNVEYGSIEIFNQHIKLASNLIKKFVAVLSVIILVLIVVITIGLAVIIYITEAKTGDVENHISKLKTEIEDLQSQMGGRVTPLIRQISDSNKRAMNYYDSLSTDIPPYVWLTYYINKEGKSVGIEGYSLEIASIYDYYNNLKVLTPQSDIKLNKLEVFGEEGKNKSSDADSLVLGNEKSQKIFSFEISNTTYQKSFDEGGNRTQVAQTQQKQQTKDAPKEKQAQEGIRDQGISSFLKSLVGKDGKDEGSGREKSFAAPIPDIPDVEINLKEIE